jgi:mRNA-degrading endonuclease toxin of MazEF toxin-antitoxin module
LHPITSDLDHYPQVRIRVLPTTNGLDRVSEIMVDKVQSLPNKRIG